LTTSSTAAHRDCCSLDRVLPLDLGLVADIADEPLRRFRQGLLGGQIAAESLDQLDEFCTAVALAAVGWCITSQIGFPASTALFSSVSIALPPIPRGGVLMIRSTETSSCGEVSTRKYARMSLTSLRSKKDWLPRMMYGNLALRSSVSKARGCSFVRNRIAKILGIEFVVLDPAADVGHDLAGFVRFVVALENPRFLTAGACCTEHLVVAVLVEDDQLVGGIEDRLGRAVIPFQPHDLCLGQSRLNWRMCLTSAPRQP